jgi:hypothetical protein
VRHDLPAEPAGAVVAIAVVALHPRIERCEFLLVEAQMLLVVAAGVNGDLAAPRPEVVD